MFHLQVLNVFADVKDAAACLNNIEQDSPMTFVLTNIRIRIEFGNILLIGEQLMS